MLAQFLETQDRSAELLRLAVAAMTKQPAPYNPITYAVWYAHASGHFGALSAELEAALATRAPVSDEQARGLYQRHLASAAELQSAATTSGLRTVLDNVESATQQTGAQFAMVQKALAAHQATLADANADAPGDLRILVRAILDNTQQAGHTLDAFAKSLQSTNAEVALLRAELSQARRQAGIDGLTGVANRRGFDEEIARILAERRPDSAGLVLLMLDIDHFKRINDSFGHLFGDRVLKAVAQVIKSAVKGRDLVARFGGEEFVVVLDGSSLQGAVSLANQIREAVAGARIRRADGSSIGTVTISIGLSEYRFGDSVEQLIERADAGLYQSKAGGRNKVTLV